MVVAFDIDPRNLQSLRDTFAAEIAAGAVVIVPKGVWEREAVLEAKIYQNSNLNTVTMASRVESSEPPQTARVPLTTIDRVVKDLRLPRVDYIKMDVEGSEAAALRGARSTIITFRPRLSIATENEPEDIEKLPALIRSFGVNYSQENGFCRKIRRFAIRPEVVVFSPL